MPVSKLLSSMGSREFSEWMEFARLEPFGPLREDQRSAEIAVRLANAYRGKDVKKPYQVWDIYPSLAEYKPRVSIRDKFLKAFGL